MEVMADEQDCSEISKIAHLKQKNPALLLFTERYKE
jgi:hypothetical protein